MKEMALQNGATKTAAGSINKLTVISSDKDLVESEHTAFMFGFDMGVKLFHQ